MGLSGHLAPRAFGCAFLVAAGCGSAAPPLNVVDAVVRTMLANHGLQAVIEDDTVLCRRLAIDLTGVPPGPDDIAAHCIGRSPRDMALHFMNEPTGAHVPDGSAPYVWVNRRWWADRFQYQSTQNDGTTWYTYVRDLDLLVSDLYAGTITYDQFARLALASPAFARRFGIFDSNHDLAQVASQAYRVFLGREALPSEAADFGNLWRGWSTEYMDDPHARDLYPDCPNVGCGHREVGLDGSACTDANELACASTILGPAAVWPSQSMFVRWDDLPAGDRDAIEQPGRLLASRREFAEAAVDRALTQYLGWWKTATYRPDTDVPAVRDALVGKFIGDGFDLRALELEIVTSLLYTQRAAQTPGTSAALPLWAFGPTKMIYAEAWIDSISLATGKQLGGCDFRFSDTSPKANSDSIQIKYRFPLSTGIAPLFYSDTANNLGGCPNATVHGSPSGLVPAVTRRVALAQLCVGAFAPPPEGTLEALVLLEYAGLGRPPTNDEMATWVKHLSSATEGGCDPRETDGCDLQKLADQLCMSLFATAQFNYY